MLCPKVLRSIACACIAVLIGVLLPMDLVHHCGHGHDSTVHVADGSCVQAASDQCVLCDQLLPTLFVEAWFPLAINGPEGLERTVPVHGAPLARLRDPSAARGPPQG